MRNGLLLSVAALLAGEGLSLAHPPVPETCSAFEAPVSPFSSPCDNPSPFCGCDDCCTNEADRARGWISAEYLIFFIKHGPNPLPLVTAGSPLGLSPSRAVFGGHSIDYDTFSGGRLVTGGWLNKDETVGLEGTGLVLERRTVGVSAVANPVFPTVLARPFVLPGGGLVSAPFAVPGTLAGGFSASSSSRLYTSDDYFLFNLSRGSLGRIDFLLGGRYLELDERLNVTTLSTPVGTATLPTRLPLSPGTALAVADQVDTTTRFWGGTLGLKGQYCLGRVVLTATGKVSLGDSQEVFFVNGATSLLTPAGVAQLPGGLLTAAGNTGRFTHDTFAVVPEVNASVGYDLTRWLRLTVGYNFLYIDKVARPGTVLGPALTAARPAGDFGGTDFYAHGVNLGATLRY
jgi:hypothetical protein